MEMNTRLQVEHPVTEMLHRPGPGRMADPHRARRTAAAFARPDQISGHAIEVRLCAEDDHFTPHTGAVRHFAEPPLHRGLRFDHAIEPGSAVTPHYDAMLGKLIAHAPSRASPSSAWPMRWTAHRALGLPTNRAFLAACLRHPVFGAKARRSFPSWPNTAVPCANSCNPRPTLCSPACSLPRIAHHPRPHRPCRARFLVRFAGNAATGGWPSPCRKAARAADTSFRVTER
jgi:hypothetical protein